MPDGHGTVHHFVPLTSHPQAMLQHYPPKIRWQQDQANLLGHKRQRVKDAAYNVPRTLEPIWRDVHEWDSVFGAVGEQKGDHTDHTDHEDAHLVALHLLVPGLKIMA